MKPQNVLLTPDLQVKLADFGSVNIALAPGVADISMDISLNKRQTSYYTAAPEYLRNPLLLRKPSMDVYSFAMIIYEILTKHRVFQQSIGYHHVVQVIIDKGQKPDGKHLQNVRLTLESNSRDLEIFEFLESIMMECWNFNAENRPDIRKVRNQMSRKLKDIVESQSIYLLKLLKSQSPTSGRAHVSAKIILAEFSSPFQEGPMPTPSYLKVASAQNEGFKAIEAKFAEHIMISYNWADSLEKAHETYYRLHDDGYDVWIDKEDMRGNLYEKMASAVNNAYVVLVFVSPNYEKSENCKREASLAADLKKRIIPIYVDENYRAKSWLKKFLAKVVFMGDYKSAKTALCKAMVESDGSHHSISTVFDNHEMKVLFKGQRFALVLCDTTGQEDYDRLRPLSYPNTDLFLLCFSVANPYSLEVLKNKFYPEMKHFCSETPFLVVGTQIQERHENLDRGKQISKAEGAAFSASLNALAYCECSPATGEGISSLLYHVFVAVFCDDSYREASLRKSKCTLQ